MAVVERSVIMDEQKNLFLSIGAFIMLISRCKRDNVYTTKTAHYLSSKGKVTDITLVNYLLAVMLMKWDSIVLDQSISSQKTIISQIKNCKKEIFSLNQLYNNEEKRSEIIDAFTKDVSSDAPCSLGYMSEFVRECIDKEKCCKMVEELLQVIRDDDEIPDDSVFFIFGNGESVTKREMVDTMTVFYADCFLLGIWQYIISKRSTVNRKGRDTLKKYFNVESDEMRSYTRAEGYRANGKNLGHEIIVALSKDHNVENSDMEKYKEPDEHKPFEYNMDALNKKEREDLVYIRNNRILRDLIKACLICSNGEYGHYYKSFIMCMSRFKISISNIEFSDIVLNDLKAIQYVLEQFFMAIKPNGNELLSVDIESAEEKKEVLKNVYNTLYGKRCCLETESVASLLSLAKV